MKQYLDLMRLIRDKGVFKEDRTGTGTYSIFAHQMRFDLSEGFPLVTTKKCHLKSIIHELLWFLKGDTNIKYLQDNGVRIWDEWADENGDLGPVYGYQWRSWPTPTGDSIDQVQTIINTLKKNPDSRRIIVSAWNPALVEQMALPPCHALFQFYSAPMRSFERWLYADANKLLKDTNEFRGLSDDKLHEALDTRGVPRRKLSCQLYQRSADVFLGVPFNIASYALLTMMVAKVTDHACGDFIWTGGDCHLYTNHLEQADLQMAREPRSLPVMKIKDRGQDLFGFEYDDFILEGYDPHPHIAGKVAV